MAVINPLDPASFAPDKSTLKDLSPFRFWCQKVLPLVYDDSLSYYELLCKVVQYLNDVIGNMSLVGEDVTNIYEAYSRLQDYVNEYFSRLDVQEEINGKLDEMAEDGTLEDLIRPFIPALVTGWLDENISPTTPPIDSSLLIEGAGADAKVTGEYARDHEIRLQDLEYFPIKVEQLTIDPSTVEVGTSVPYVNIAFAFNKQSASTLLTYPGSAISFQPDISGVATADGPFTENTAFTVQGQDTGSPHNPPAQATKSATLAFLHKVHYGVYEDAALSDDLLTARLQEHVLTTTRARTITVTPGPGQYIWYALPVSFGTPKFAVGPLQGGFTLKGTFLHTNQSGGQAQYQVWQSDQPNLGNKTITIS